MLDGLHGIDWAGLTHAYGPADDVPDLIRGLLAADADDRAEARHELYSCIAHQGTRYPATAPAVPFLLALLADPATPDRGELVDLLGFVATGEERQGWRRYPVADLRGAGPSPGLAAYDAVAAGVPLFVDLAGDPDAELAVPAADALAVFPEHADRSVPPLAAAAADDDAPVAVTTAALLALGALAPTGTARHDATLGRRMGDDDAGVRWAAALTACRLRRPGLLPDAAAELRRWADRLLATGYDAGPPWYGLREDLALDELAVVDPHGHDGRLWPIIEGLLARTPASNWHNDLITILDRAGLMIGSQADGDLRPWGSLSPTQRRLVEHLRDRPDIFAADRTLMPLAWSRLPDTPEGLRRYVPD